MRTALRVYHETVSGFDSEDIEAVVKDFISGRVEGQSLTFLPPAPMLATQLRLRRDRRLAQDEWTVNSVKQLALRNECKEHDEPTRTQIVAAALQKSPLFEPEAIDPVKADEDRAKLTDRMRKHDAMFIENDPRPMDERLGLRRGK